MTSNDEKEIININDIEQADFTKIDSSEQLPISENIVTPIIEPSNKPDFNLQEFLHNIEKKKKSKKRKNIKIAILVVFIVMALNSLLFGFMFTKGLDDMPIPEEFVVELFEEYNYELASRLTSIQIKQQHPDMYDSGITAMYYFKDRFNINNITIYYFELHIQARTVWEDYDIAEDPNIAPSARDKYQSRCMNNVFLIGTNKAIEIFDPMNSVKFKLLMEYKSRED